MLLCSNSSRSVSTRESYEALGPHASSNTLRHSRGADNRDRHILEDFEDVIEDLCDIVLYHVAKREDQVHRAKRPKPSSHSSYQGRKACRH